MDRTYFEEVLEATGGEMRSPLDRSLSAGSLHLFSKTPAEVNLYGAAAPGEGGAPQLRVHVRIRACV